MATETLLRAMAHAAFLSVCLAPFLFGAVERSIWVPLCQTWLALGFASAVLQRRLDRGQADWLTSAAVSRAALPIHALFLLQLTPMPASVMRWLSTGSLNAHFLPNPGDGRWRSLSVSPAATVEAWLYFAALQGLVVALQALPKTEGRRYLLVLLGVAGGLGAEGLWQSRTEHPFWLYGAIPFFAPSGLESGSFGPYFNRNHFATVTAMGASLAAGLAASMVPTGQGFIKLLREPSRFAQTVTLCGLSVFLVLATAASGSRSGLVAAAAGIAAILWTRLKRWQIGVGLGVLGIAVILSGAASIERFMSMQLVASRLPAWADMVRMVAYFPVFGAGIGAFGAAYWPYQMNVRYEYWIHAHNEYLEWIIEGGLLGIIALALMTRRLRERLETSASIAEPVLAALVAFAVQAAADYPARIPANAAFAICLSAIAARPRSH